MGFSVNVYNAHVVNALGTIMRQVTYQKFNLMFRGLWLLLNGGCLDTYGCSFVLCMVWPAFMRESSRTYVGVKDFRSDPQPCYGDHCDAPWLDLLSCSWGYFKWRRWRCSHHIIWLDLGDLGHISGRGHLFIPAHPGLSRLLLTAAPSAMSSSSPPASSGVQLGQGHPLGYPPVPPPTALSSSFSPFPYPVSDRRHGLQSWTPPGPWALQWDILL